MGTVIVELFLLGDALLPLLLRDAKTSIIGGVECGLEILLVSKPSLLHVGSCQVFQALSDRRIAKMLSHFCIGSVLCKFLPADSRFGRCAVDLFEVFLKF